MELNQIISTRQPNLVQPQVQSKRKAKKKGDGKHREAMNDLGDYVEYQYVPQIMKMAKYANYKSQPNMTRQNQCLIFLLFRTGRRPEELVRTKVMDIDFKEGMINWWIMKKRKPHRERIPVDKVAINYLQKYVEDMKLLPEHYLFSWWKHGVTDRAVNYQNLDRRKAWQIVRVAADMADVKAQNLKSITPRIIRHSFAVHLIKKGKQLNVVKDLLFHSNIATTSIYAQFSKKDLAKQLEGSFDDD